MNSYMVRKEGSLQTAVLWAGGGASSMKPCWGTRKKYCLMIEILSVTFKDPILWELWRIPNYGVVQEVYIINRSSSFSWLELRIL